MLWWPISCFRSLFQYETDPSPEHILDALSPLRQPFNSAHLLIKPVISKLIQALIGLFEYTVKTEHQWDKTAILELHFIQDSIGDILRLDQTGVLLTSDSIEDILSKIDALQKALPPQSPSPSGPSEDIIETFEVFRPKQQSLPEDCLEFLPDFIAEAHQHIQSAETSLTEIYSEGSNAERISTIFRAIHTIKGASGF